MTNRLRFIVNGKLIEVADVDPHTSLLDFLREQQRLTGSKEGCAEGDCGACTVVIGELAQDANDNDRVSLTPINACIRLLPTLDGKAVFTVESLKAASGMLHPTQQAMVDCHGSQCGFCTPGFVMSLFALFKNETVPTRERTCEAIAGNLCRCTGYRPILDAAQVMYQAAPQPSLSRMEQWMFTPATTDAAPMAGEAELAATLRGLAHQDALQITSTHGTFIAPKTVEGFSAAVLANPEAWILGGGTDIGLWVNKALQTNATIIYTGEVAALKHIDEPPNKLRIGSAVSLEEAFRALNRHYPEFAHVWSRFASWPIRSSGTLGGNVANGSPIGDSMPVLIAIGAEVILRRGEHQRAIALEALYLDYKKQSREPDEWVEAITVPRRETFCAYGTLHVACYKNAKRNEQDISAVFVAIVLAEDEGFVTHCRIVYGGMAGTPKRAAHAEEMLIGKSWGEASVRATMEALTRDYQPMTDMRASAAYRMQVAQNLLLRFWLEASGETLEARVF